MYVRTDFHIYEIKSEEIIQGKKYYNIEIRGCLNKLKSEFGKQAKTIEELCDEYVVVNNTCFNTPQLLGTVIDKDYYKHEEVYGAIWTDKGLIYVAKLNYKGELELI